MKPFLTPIGFMIDDGTWSDKWYRSRVQVAEAVIVREGLLEHNVAPTTVLKIALRASCRMP